MTEGARRGDKGRRGGKGGSQAGPSFSTLVAALRKERGYTQAQVARAVGCSSTWISRVEQGTAVPDGALVVALTEFLQAPTAEWLALARVKPPQWEAPVRVGAGTEEEKALLGTGWEPFAVEAAPTIEAGSYVWYRRRRE